MLHSLVSLFILLYLRRSFCVEEDNLGNALNSLENRQRQLASHYYALPNKDSEREGFQVNDDSLMYLGGTPPNYDTPHHNRFLSEKGKNAAHSKGDEYDPSVETAEGYQRALTEGLLDQLVSEMLISEGEEIPEPRAQKKSFFREREINEVSDNLQDLQPELSVDETFAPRLKSKSNSPNRRVSQLQDLEDLDGSYLNAVDPLGRKYDVQTLRNRDSETFDPDELDAFFKYLVKDRDHYADDDDGEDDYSRETHRNENRNRDRDRSKRYWLGSHRPSQIRKRSTSIEEKPKTSSNRTSDERLNVSSARPLNATSDKATPIKRDKKGQAEVPIDLKSLKPLNIKKKSIDWSNYFGVDKRQKKSNKHQTSKEPTKGDVLLDQYIQSYILQSVRDSAFNNRGSDYGRYPKRTSDQREYLNANKNSQVADDLRSAEDIIIDHVLKYTGAHQGVTDPQALRRYKERVINELGAAYSLEKLRYEIEPKNQFRMKRQQHQHPDYQKVAAKKENANLLPADVDLFRVKPNNTKMHIPDSYNFLNSQTSGLHECPILEEFIYECSIISEQEMQDYNHVLVPACAFHKLCSFCTNESMHACAVGFFERVSGICWENAVPQCYNRAVATLHFLQRETGTRSFVHSQCKPCLNDLLIGRTILKSEE